MTTAQDTHVVDITDHLVWTDGLTPSSIGGSRNQIWCILPL